MRSVTLHVGNPMKHHKKDVLQGTLALMVLKTLDVLGPLHGYGIARRIEQISGDLLAVNQGTLYPVLLKLEQEAPSLPSGAPPRTIVARASIASPAKAASSCSSRLRIGSKPPRSSRVSLPLRPRTCHEIRQALFQPPVQ